jgi:hypothetical protein
MFLSSVSKFIVITLSFHLCYSINTLIFTNKRHYIELPQNKCILSETNEKALIEVFLKKGEYLSSENLSPERLFEIQNLCDKVIIQYDQGYSIRKQLLVDKVVAGSTRLHKNFNFYFNLYDKNQINVEDICCKYDIPAMQLLRMIFNCRIKHLFSHFNDREVKDIVKKLFRREEIYNVKRADIIKERDEIQISIAKQIDQLSFNDK